MKYVSIRFPLLPAPQRRSRNASRSCRRAIAVLLCSATLIVGMPALVQAQTFTERIQSLFTRRREAGSASGRSTGGAIRSGSCQISDLDRDRPLTALIPADNLGKTSKDYPTFWFYSPFFVTPDSDLMALFTLLDENGNPVLQNREIPLTLPAQPGLVSFQLPATEAPLQPGEQYNWYFTITCPNPNPGDSYPFQDITDVNGWIERVELSPDVAAQLGDPATNAVQIYADQDLWYEMVTQLAQTRTRTPEDWAYLLSLFELQDLADNAVTELRPMAP